MRTKLTLSLITTALLFGTTTLLANTSDKNITSNETYMKDVKDGKFKKEVSKKETLRLNDVVKNTVKEHNDLLKKPSKEFISGLNNTVKVLGLIKSNKIEEAKKVIAQAEKDFTTAFKKEPKLGLIPIRENTDVISFNGSAKLIEDIKESAEDLLKHNDTQLAIDMLAPLQDEVIINIQYVPAYLYPKAIKDASKALEDGKKELAFATIVTVLEATQLDTIIVPIPLLTAQSMVLEASKLEKSHKKEALKLLQTAQEELQKAVLLGYTKEYKSDYKSIDKAIDELETEIKGKNVVVKLYEDLLKKFKDLTDKQK